MSQLLTLLTRAKPFALGTMLVLASLFSWALPPGAAELLMYEQKYVNRTLDTDKIMALNNYQAEKYSPEKGNIFEVKSYWLPKEGLHVFEVPAAMKALGLEFERTEKGQKQVLFLVHPESTNFYKALVHGAEPGPQFKATSTASSRTLMMWPTVQPDKVFFGKLSLDKEIGGVVRTIPKGEVARSVGVSQILDAARGELPKAFGYLPEFFGVMPEGMERGGMLLRSLPPAMMSGEVRVMPLFAVYTKPDSKTPSPVQEMIKVSGLRADALVIQKILRPFAQQWVDLAINHGIAIEAHAQNVLMEIDRKGLPTGRFVYRDFGGFNVDLSFRREHGRALPTKLPVIDGEKLDYHQAHHEKALRQSLETYFEGGFLFGLGQEMERLGNDHLNYEKLTTILHNEIKAEMKLRGAPLGRSNFFDALLKAVEDGRTRTARFLGQCGKVLIAK